MNWLVFHIVSGHSFFTGVSLLIVAVGLSMRPGRIPVRIIDLVFLIGLIAIAVSSTAIPYGVYAVAASVTLLWTISRSRKWTSRWIPSFTIGIWTLAAVIEIPYHIIPRLMPTDHRSITIIGDSVTAGIDGDETSERWPSLLAREHQLLVQDISHIGETAASAGNRVKQQPVTGSIVIIEIGGNDILGSTTVGEFESDLSGLLAHLAVPGRQLVMFELPLPPFFHEYGRVQRKLAYKYNVRLIPKRVFLSVIAGKDFTLDSIHLTQSGHQKMADSVGRILKPALVSRGRTASLPRTSRAKP